MTVRDETTPAFPPHEFERVSFKLVDGRRSYRIVHIPTKLFVEAFTSDAEPNWMLCDRLMKELIQKLTVKMSGDDHSLTLALSFHGRTATVYSIAFDVVFPGDELKLIETKTHD